MTTPTDRAWPLRLVVRDLPSPRWLWLSPVLALALTVVSGALLLLAFERDPLQGLQVFVLDPLSTRRGWAELGLKATPLMLCAAGLALSFRANVWNIGAEGQLIAGGIAGGGIALLATPTSPTMFVPMVLIGAALGGALWAALVALLRDRFNANEILVSLMLVYVAQLALSWLVHGPWRDPTGFGFPQSALIAAPARMPVIVEGTRLTIGLPIALAAAAVLWAVLARSVIGFQLKVVGTAPMAARYAGFSQRRTLWFVLLLTGALAGLAGGLEVAGPIGQLTPTISPGYGFAAIIVAFVGRLHPLGIVPAALLLAQFYIGGELAQSRLGLPGALSAVYQGMLLFFLLACDTLIVYRVQRTRPVASG